MGRVAIEWQKMLKKCARKSFKNTIQLKNFLSSGISKIT